MTPPLYSTIRPTMTPSLYSAVRLACLVHRVRDRLKTCIKICLPSTKPAKSSCPNHLTTYARKAVSSTIKFQSNLTPYLARRHPIALFYRCRGDFASLLDALDLQAQPGHLTLGTVAAQDCLFIKHDSYLASLPRSLGKLYDILDLTNTLLDRLQNCSGSSIESKRNSIVGDVVYDDSSREKYVANLEHLLRYLRQAALDAIIRHCLNIVAAYILHWHHYWLFQRRIDEGWFAEWPNNQRPLSTTWPWNVKPSLLVLWGVCWMFYGFSAQKNPTRNRRGTEPLGEDFWTRRSGRAPPPLPIQQSNATYHNLGQPRQQHLINSNTPTTSEPSEAWAGPASYSHPNFSWLHPQQPGTRRANDPSHDSHAQSRDFPPPVTNSLTNRGDSPATTYQAGLAESPYINATSRVSSHLFPAVSWPYNQGITQGIDQYQPPAHALGYTPWQSVYNPVENLTASSQRTRTDSSPQFYGPPRPVATPQAAARSLGHLGFGLELQMHGNSNYPSPHSDVSGPTSSSCLSVLPHAMTSPSMPLVASPSVAGSLDFRHSSRRSQEPPRNIEGIMYCDHRECADNPPVFPRKCEWSKHMDKHNRPYVCEEPGCEKINGFTYSGGLSRHQREVHRQHGGPKASCHCPHKDCKRSTGVGFSRKENLQEHLRRVHRDAGTEQTEELEIPLNEAPSAIGSRKRRRPVADDADEGDEVGMLQQEVKKLRKELQEKDERLKRLEQVVAQLAKGQHKEIVR